MRLRLTAPLAIVFALSLTSVSRTTPAAFADVTTTWQAEYFNNTSLSGPAAVTRSESAIDYDWGFGSPDPAVNVDNFGARWTGTITVTAGTYRFTATADDGVRVLIDGAPVVDEWADHLVAAAFAVDVSLSAGSHTVTMEYYEHEFGALARLQIAAAADWQAEYFNDESLAGPAVVTRTEAAIDDDWGFGSPDPAVDVDAFSARWTRSSSFSAKTYRFTATADDGVRVIVDGARVIDQWTDHLTATAFVADVPLTAGLHTVVMEYYEHQLGALARLQIALAPDWQAEYFNNTSLSGPPVLTRTESAVDYDWGFGSPDPAVHVDDFSARWTRTIEPPPGAYRFTTTTDDGARLYLDGDLIIDQWLDQPATAWEAVRTLGTGPHTIVIEYYEHLFGAEARFQMDAVNEKLSGFQADVVASGLFLPTHAAYTPDGRFFIAEKSGTIRVVKNGQVLPTPLVTIPSVNTYQDRGLLSIALDPGFAQNGYLYAAYTHDVNPADFTGPKTARLIRLTVTGDSADLATEVVLLGSVVGDAAHPSCDDLPLGADCMPSDGRTHTIGDVEFSPDGKIFVTMGEGAPDITVNAQALRAQQLDSLGGKMLRINADGTAPADNPFYNGDPNANRSKVWAYGFRNAFRFGIRPETGLPYAGDVGWGAWEEVDVVRRGANYGWPCYEAAEYLIGYSIYQQCQDLNQSGTAAPPLYYYPHPPSSAVVGGAFYEGTAYPAPYQGAFFFGDYARNNISTLRVDAADQLVPGSVTSFTDGGDGPVQIFSGPDSDIYYVSINRGQLRHIRYVQGDRPPIPKAAASPAAGLLPLPVQFSSAGSIDPESEPMTFHWLFGDGSESTAANPSHTYAVAGVYNVEFTAKDDHGLTGTATVHIVAGNAPPVATITSPAPGTLYNVGDTVAFSGGATDLEDGTLADAALSWNLTLHHCEITTNTCHIHPFLSATGGSGSFVIPDHGEGVSFELILTARDSAGVTDVKSVTINPHLIPLTLDSSPQQLTIVLDGVSHTTPAIVNVAMNSAHMIFAPSPQTLPDASTATFGSWSDLGAQSHPLIASAPATLAASFTQSGTPTPTVTPTDTPTPTATATPTATPLDSDGDGYSDEQEIAIGKDPFTYCRLMRADVDYDGFVSILDLARVAQYFTQTVPPAPERYKQDADNQISILDLTRMAQVFTQSVNSCP